MGGTQQLVTCERDGAVAVIQLNRPERANSMDAAMFAAIAAALDDVRADRSVRAVVLSGAGRHFCAGGDLEHPLFEEDDELVRRRQIEEAYAVTTRLLELPQPIVSAVQGRCAGAGLALVLGSDIRVSAAGARFSLDFVRLGLAPDMGLCWLLASSIGTGRALEFALTGQLMTAAQMLEWGVVSRVVEDGAELPSALEAARSLAEHPPGGMARIRRLVRTAPFVDRDEAFDQEITTMTELAATPDARRLLRAFTDRSRRAG